MPQLSEHSNPALLRPRQVIGVCSHMQVQKHLHRVLKEDPQHTQTRGHGKPNPQMRVFLLLLPQDAVPLI